MLMMTSAPTTHGALGAATAAVLLLSACSSSENGESPDEETASSAEPTSVGNDSADSDAQSIAQFCASDPEVTDGDERLMGVGPLPDGEPTEIPVPYLDQLQASEDYQPPTEEAPAENVPEPQLSALLCDADAGNDAADAALSQWLEFLRYGELAKDTSYLEELIHPDCEVCQGDIEEIEQLAASDQWLVEEPVVGELHMWQVGEDPDAPIGFVELIFTEYTVYDEDGEAFAGESVEHTAGMEFAYVEDAGHWQLISIREAAMGDDVFEEGLNSSGDADRPDPDDIETPEVPDDAQEMSAAGALATYEFFHEAFDYVIQTGDSTPLAAVTHTSNAALIEFYEQFEEIYEEGGHAELTSESEFSDVEVFLEPDGATDVAIVSGTANEANWNAYGSNGELIIEQDGVETEDSISALGYDPDVGHWQILESTVEDVGSLWEELGIDPAPEPDLTR